MPLANVRGANINYEVIGTRGNWIAPGGRLGLENVRSIAQRLADAGYRVLIHDRRNCGASDVLLEGREPEHEIWAADLYELLSQLGAPPAYIGGRSSGCRLALIFALRYPQAVRALLLWRITGGPYAAERLADKYYGEYIDAARQGGMAAVCGVQKNGVAGRIRPATPQLAERGRRFHSTRIAIDHDATPYRSRMSNAKYLKKSSALLTWVNRMREKPGRGLRRCVGTAARALALDAV